MLTDFVARLSRRTNVRVRLLLALFTALALCAASLAWLSHANPTSPSSSYRLWDKGLAGGQPRFSETPLVEIEGLVLGAPFEPRDRSLSADETFVKVAAALLDRYKAKTIIDNPHCKLNTERYKSSGTLEPSHVNSGDRSISVALNLYNSQAVLPSLSLAILEIIAHLQPTHEIHISIFENDSKDITVSLLGDLASALISLGISSLTFRSSSLQRAPTTRRILGLANLRNEALFPLLPYMGNGTLLFINDVITCGADLLELIHQLHLQNAHVAMSTDWQLWTGQGPEPQFRDMWVARGINGDLTYPMSRPDGFSMYGPSGNWLNDFLVTQSEEIHKRWLDGRPVPMYSGWNGAVAFRANLFTEYHVRFRASGKGLWHGGDVAGRLGKWGTLLGSPGYLENDCAASECELLARDIWNLLDGKARFVLAPQSRMVYEPHHWSPVSEMCPPVLRRSEDSSKEEMVDWTMATMPSEVVCVPILNSTGHDVDPWGDGNMRYMLGKLLLQHPTRKA